MLWAFPSSRAAYATLLLSQAPSIALSPPPLARAVPSPAFGLLLPVLVHVSLWTLLVLDTVPSPASGAMPCPLSPTLSCSHGTVSQAVGWVDGCSSGMSVAWLPPWLIGWLGGEARCLFSLPECLEPQNGLAWISPVVSSSPRHLGSPRSCHHLKPTQN